MRTAHACRRVVVAMIIAAPAGLALAQSDAAAAWAGLVARSPCEWLDPAAMTPIVGPGVSGQPRTTLAETGCTWRTGNGRTLLSAAVVSFTSAATLAQERDSMLQQIAQYGGDRFERLPSPGSAVTIVIRNDHGRLAVFPNGGGQAQAIAVNAHFVPKEDAEQKAARRERALAFVRELVRRHGL